MRFPPDALLPRNFTVGSGSDSVPTPHKDRMFRELTIREYAAIHLKVPDSGLEWLDEMISKSNNT